MEDGEYILGEFGFGAGIRLVENHDFSAVLLDQLLDEFKSESGEPVLVGDHNSEFISAVKPLQYGDESSSLPGESTGGVSDNLGSGIEFPHLGDLTLEVSPLLGGADPAVADCFCVRLSS